MNERTYKRMEILHCMRTSSRLFQTVAFLQLCHQFGGCQARIWFEAWLWKYEKQNQNRKKTKTKTKKTKEKLTLHGIGITLQLEDDN